MYHTLLFYFIRSLLLFLSFKLCSFIKINSIFHCFSASFSLLHGVLPVVFQSSLLGKCYVLFQCSYKNFLYKLPGYSNIISYTLLGYRSYSNIIKKIIILLFLSIFFIFTFIFKNTIIYGIPWLFCTVYILIRIERQFSVFDLIFISTWVAHAVGTITYGLLNGFLLENVYLKLLPIAILERALFVLSAILLLRTINFVDFQLKKIFEAIFKKKLTLKL
jgi:hypothetical protein